MSASIDMVDQSSNLEELPDDENALCPFCEMAVFWMQVELRKKRTKDNIFRYVNEVNILPIMHFHLFSEHFAGIICVVLSSNSFCS